MGWTIAAARIYTVILSAVVMIFTDRNYQKPIKRLKSDPKGRRTLLQYPVRFQLCIGFALVFCAAELLIAFFIPKPWPWVLLYTVLPFLFLPRSYVARNDRHLLINGKALLIEEVAKIRFEEKARGALVHIQLRNQETLCWKVSRDAERFFHDLAVCLPAGYWDFEEDLQEETQLAKTI